MFGKVDCLYCYVLFNRLHLAQLQIIVYSMANLGDISMISTKQLSYALAVERTLHFKKAAADCNISQSALSTALSELEKQLGAADI